MEKIVSYKILPKLNLIIEVFQGEINIADAIELKREEIQHTDYSPNYNFIVVIQDLMFDNLTESDISKYFESLRHENKIFGNRKSALLTRTPGQVVAGTLYESAAREFPMNFKIVSTIKAAMVWTDVALEYESEILNEIDLIINSTGKN